MEETKKVTGVYKNNIGIRNELIKKGEKYAMFQEPMQPSIGELYDIYARINQGPERMGSGGLLENTHGTKSNLSQLLNERYFFNPDDLEVYTTPLVASEFLQKYRGKYDNYSEYTSNLGYTHNEDFAKSYDEIGYIDNVNIGEGLVGKSILNPNGIEEDTTLGKLSSQFVAETLNKTVIESTKRKPHYITAYLETVYGLNENNVNDLASKFVFNEETGRIFDIDENVYLRELDYRDNGDYANWTDYVTYTVKENNTHDTAYNRYLNLYDNPRWSQSTSYQNRHLLYDPFTQYLGLVWMEGESITNYEYSTPSTLEYGIHKEYNEGDTINNQPDIVEGNIIDGSDFEAIDDYLGNTSDEELIKKTNELFKDRKIGTLIGRFHTSPDTTPGHTAATLTQSAVSKFGLSHGRNLLTEKAWTNGTPNIDNGYSNPYCRVWTYHHQYHRLQDAIRPFMDENGPMAAGSLQGDWGKGLRASDGGKRLEEYGVLNSNGLVNIAPTKGTSGVNIKNCMFSIENLAWKDVNKTKYINGTDQILSPEQIGPNGGRIMWFPPYDLTFNEQVSANWNEEQFIGRGEPVVTYANTSRKGTITFTMLVDHPSIVDSWRKGISNPSEDDEQQLLRFFAGCGTLTPSDTINTVDKESEDEGIDSTPLPITIDPQEEPETQHEAIFYIFYPNNYSGVDDAPEDMVHYLLTGKNYALGDRSNMRGYETGSQGISDSSDPLPGDDKTGTTHTYAWNYRVDNKYYNQKLYAGNYSDTASFNYNTKLTSVKNAGKSDATCSFAEFYMALMGNDTTSKKAIESYLIGCGADSSRVDTLSSVLSKAKISSIIVDGGASSHGYTNENTSSLAPDRARSISSWLRGYLTSKDFSIEVGTTNEITVANNSLDVSCSSAKLGRYARVTIKYTAPEASTLQENVNNNWSYTISSSTVYKKTGDTITSSADADYLNGLTAATNTIVKGLKDVQRVKGKVQYLVSKVSKLKDNSLGNGYRYDYEKEYFQRLAVQDPVMHKRIVDKIKYFDPAFHSITPEGFNARLTFLHQCTRQGHTISAADTASGWGNSAGNLAFGRPPICVLRLGDFFHCKIAITNMNIDYDTNNGIQWDQNPEGIGLQPMSCKVTLSITFLGGSDIAAPVARLQNAVSFNYYANTSIYDNRSDTSKYNTSKEEPEVNTQWTPTPNNND